VRITSVEEFAAAWRPRGRFCGRGRARAHQLNKPGSLLGLVESGVAVLAAAMSLWVATGFCAAKFGDNHDRCVTSVSHRWLLVVGKQIDS